MSEEFKKSDLEILVSTMNRNNLDFLVPMFPFGNFSDFKILIVNQTTEDLLLKSDFPNIRVVNSFEKGLSKSRNLALKNATGKIVLIADDDVQYIENFDENIADAFNKNGKASVICFQTITPEKKPFSTYKNEKFIMNRKNVFWVLSIEMAIKKEDIILKEIEFNEHFGLGAKFEDSESLFFLRRAIYIGLQVLFYPKYIVQHEKKSSSDEISSERWLYAKGASLYKRYQGFSYLWMLKIILFLWRKNVMPFNKVGSKMKVGIKGIEDYKILVKNNLEHYFK